MLERAAHKTREIESVRDACVQLTKEAALGNQEYIFCAGEASENGQYSRMGATHLGQDRRCGYRVTDSNINMSNIVLGCTNIVMGVLTHRYRLGHWPVDSRQPPGTM